MTKQSVTAIILTFNEEIHLQRCIDSIKAVCEKIIVVDSFSTDSTEKIAIKNQIKFVQNKWVNYAVQFNWALDNLSIDTEWILRIDADEYLSKELQLEIKNELPKVEKPINGIVMPLRRVFMGKHIKYGTGQVMLLRLFRKGKARSEMRWMDEHIQLLEGETMKFKNPFSDHNLNTLGWWSKKHIGYSIREAIELLDLELNFLPKTNVDGKLSLQALRKRKLKNRYAKQPLFLRAFGYFLYRYVFRLGFIEGRRGFLWHFLQGWWYRTMVDCKIYEVKMACGKDREKVISYLKSHYNIDVLNDNV